MRKRRIPQRRTIYDKTFDHAQARLDSLIAERTKCLLRLSELSQEIPYYEGVVAALTPPTTSPGPPQLPPGLITPPVPGYAPTPPTVAPNQPENGQPGASQEEFLARFKPRPGRMRSNTPPPPDNA